MNFGSDETVKVFDSISYAGMIDQRINRYSEQLFTYDSYISNTVKSVYNDVMLGNVVCVEHIGGYTAYYCGLTDTPNVSEGDIVYAGDTVGYVGIVPLEMLDESHLHLEVQKNGEYIDPVKLFSK